MSRAAASAQNDRRRRRRPAAPRRLFFALNSTSVDRTARHARDTGWMTRCRHSTRVSFFLSVANSSAIVTRCSYAAEDNELTMIIISCDDDDDADADDA